MIHNYIEQDLPKPSYKTEHKEEENEVSETVLTLHLHSLRNLDRDILKNIVRLSPHLSNSRVSCRLISSLDSLFVIRCSIECFLNKIFHTYILSEPEVHLRIKLHLEWQCYQKSCNRYSLDYPHMDA